VPLGIVAARDSGARVIGVAAGSCSAEVLADSRRDHAEAARRRPAVRRSRLMGLDLLRFLAQDGGGYDVRCEPWT